MRRSDREGEGDDHEARRGNQACKVNECGKPQTVFGVADGRENGPGPRTERHISPLAEPVNFNFTSLLAPGSE